MQDFQSVFDRAAQRKGGEKQLLSLMSGPLSEASLAKISDDRYLSMMTKCINCAGFSWKVIERKWPEFEQAFFTFKIGTLLMLSDDQWEGYTQDKRVVRNWQKIKTVRHNARFINEQNTQHNGFASLIAHWSSSDQVGLEAYLKKHGSRLGGQTSRWFLRAAGKDGFVLSKDVISTLISAGLDIKPQITTKKEAALIQQAFNQWHEESGLPFTHLSKIAAYSCGDNVIGI